MRSEDFRYGFSVRYVRVLGYFLLILSFLRGVFYLLIGFYSLNKISQYGSVILINSLLYFLVYSRLIPFILLLAIQVFGDITIDDVGLHFKFITRNLVAKWNDIVEIEPVVLFGVIKNPNRKIIIATGKLPLIYRFYGFLYTGSFWPAIPVSPSINRYLELLEKISTRIKHEDSRTNHHPVR